jgi:hypothetical protein
MPRLRGDDKGPDLVSFSGWNRVCGPAPPLPLKGRGIAGWVAVVAPPPPAPPQGRGALAWALPGFVIQLHF